MSRVTVKAFRKAPAGIATGQCLCGKVQVEISIPAFWAWHDHSRVSRRAHCAAYATYVGCWRSRFRVAKGERGSLPASEDQATGDTRAFCSHCGTPVVYTRGRSSKMVNIPRALFDGRTGRQPLYHVAIGDLPEWAYRYEKLRPLQRVSGRSCGLARNGANAPRRPTWRSSRETRALLGRVEQSSPDSRVPARYDDCPWCLILECQLCIGAVELPRHTAMRSTGTG